MALGSGRWREVESGAGSEELGREDGEGMKSRQILCPKDIENVIHFIIHHFRVVTSRYEPVDLLILKVH